jgi:trans-aconitate methyltransferase
MACRTPPNCIFEVDDFESDWLYHQPFDYVHARELEGCIANPDRLFRQALKHLAPGGYLEMQAVDGFFESDDGTAEQAVHAQAWIKSMLDGARNFGKPLDTCSKWKEQMEDAGFVDVRQEVFKVSRYFGGTVKSGSCWFCQC